MQNELCITITLYLILPRENLKQKCPLKLNSDYQKGHFSYLFFRDKNTEASHSFCWFQVFRLFAWQRCKSHSEEQQRLQCCSLRSSLWEQTTSRTGPLWLLCISFYISYCSLQLMAFFIIILLLQLLEISFNCLEEVESNIPVSPLHLAVSMTTVNVS